MAQFDSRYTQATTVGRADVDEGLRAYMLGVYNYMAAGVALTGIVAYLVFSMAVTSNPGSAAATLPNGQMLRDGDGFSDGRYANLGATPLLCYAYTGDSVIKGDFERQGGLPGDPMLVLLLNDPDLAAAKKLDSLPLTIDFGPILGSMIARTGWNLTSNAADVVVEMKGGGYHFGNHQHSDAGSFQVYYRGLQVADLGQYHFYEIGRAHV